MRDLNRALILFEETGRRAMLGATHAVGTHLAAHRGDWSRMGHHLSQTTRLLEATGFVNAEVADALEHAAALARLEGEDDLAEEAEACAREQRRSLAAAAERVG